MFNLNGQFLGQSRCTCLWRGYVNKNSNQITLFKELIDSSHTSMSTAMVLQLFCIIYPREKPSKYAFSVKLGNDKTIDHLKDAIKHENANYLKDIDANELTLYKLSIPGKDMSQALSTLRFDESDDRVEELDPMDSLDEVFPNGVEEEHLHIVAVKPSTWCTRSDCCDLHSFISKA